MTILMWFFLMVWAVVFLLYLIGMIMTNVKSGTAGLINTLLGLVAWVIFSLVYWGILGRVPNSEQSIFNGLKMPKSGKTALNCLTIFQYYLHNLPCFAGDLVYF